MSALDNIGMFWTKAELLDDFLIQNALSVWHA